MCQITLSKNTEKVLKKYIYKKIRKKKEKNTVIKDVTITTFTTVTR